MANTGAADETVTARLSRVPLHRYAVQAAGKSWQIDAVADQDALLAASDHFAAFPYGLLLWDSAPVLADALAALGPLEGKRVLELGAGVGLVGLVARHLGGDVVQTDHAAEALELSRRNAALNRISGIVQHQADWCDWADWADTAFADLAGSGEGTSGRFDLIIGSDILYDGAAHGPIADVLSASLAENGMALLSDPGRTATPFFIRDMRAGGWAIDVAKHEVGALQPTRPGETLTISILEFRRG